MILIIVPTKNYEALEIFYKETLLFPEDDDGFMIPGHERQNIRLHLQIDRSEDWVNRKRNTYFRYSVDKNFLSYCKTLKGRGVVFEVVGSTPGGYAAKFSDPDGNPIEIECDSFDEVDKSIDPSEWACYKRY